MAAQSGNKAHIESYTDAPPLRPRTSLIFHLLHFINRRLDVLLVHYLLLMLCMGSWLTFKRYYGAGKSFINLFAMSLFLMFLFYCFYLVIVFKLATVTWTWLHLDKRKVSNLISHKVWNFLIEKHRDWTWVTIGIMSNIDRLIFSTWKAPSMR